MIFKGTDMMIYKDSMFDLVIAAVGCAGQLAMDRFVNDPQYASECFHMTLVGQENPTWIFKLFARG